MHPIFWICVGILIDQANTRGWLKLAYDKAKLVILGWLGTKTEDKPK